MRKLLLLAGIAALTVSLPVSAQHGHGNGGGKPAAQGHESHGGGRGSGQGGNHGQDHGQGHAQQARASDDHPTATGRGRNTASSTSRADARQERRVERAIRQERDTAREAREIRHSQNRAIEQGRREDRRILSRQSGDSRGWTERRQLSQDRFDIDRGDRELRGRRLAVGRAGCPSGLARQNAFCMPPGQLRKAELIGQRMPFSSLDYNVPERYRYRFPDSDQFIYRYGDDGTIYGFERSTGLVSSIFPLTSTGLFLGEPMPLGYDVYNVPLAYRNYYPDSSDYLYRYDDSAIYRVDRDTNLVDGIVALLTGGTSGLGGLGIGDRLPMGYDAYNVPLDYRDAYYDTDDSLYRYADGNVYQVDPQTQLIEAVISLLT